MYSNQIMINDNNVKRLLCFKNEIIKLEKQSQYNIYCVV